MQMPTGSYIPGKPYLVTIYGAAGSGKSVLAKAVVETLGEAIAARVPTDYFFVPREPNEPLPAYLAKPLAWDWDLLRERLSLPIGTDATTPDADFEAFTRIAASGGRPLSIRSVMLLDAMAPFPEADLAVRLDVPAAVRRERIISRDERWGTRVRDRWAHLEETWHAVPEVVPDLVLDGTCPMEDNVAALVAMILGKGKRERRDGQ